MSEDLKNRLLTAYRLVKECEDEITNNDIFNVVFQTRFFMMSSFTDLGILD